jgi:hypothetical protein
MVSLFSWSNANVEVLKYQSVLMMCVGIRLRTVAADDLNTGMLQMPLRQCPRGAVGQQVEEAMAFKICPNRPVAMAASNAQSFTPGTRGVSECEVRA